MVKRQLLHSQLRLDNKSLPIEKYKKKQIHQEHRFQVTNKNLNCGNPYIIVTNADKR